MGLIEQMLLTDFLDDIGGQEAHPGLLSVDFTQNMIRVRVNEVEDMYKLPQTYLHASTNTEYGIEYTIINLPNLEVLPENPEAPEGE